MNYPYYIISKGNRQISQPKNGEERKLFIFQSFNIRINSPDPVKGPKH